MDTIEIKQISINDLEQARKFAEQGMHLDWYVNNSLELFLYSKYVLYLELSKSTVALGAYLGERLVGFLFARFKDEEPAIESIKHKLFLKLGSGLINLSGHKDNSDAYDQANKEMLQAFSKKNYEGELTFFAVDPELKGKRIGTLLLEKLVSLKRGKTIYLYTDSGSTYQFYLHRGFEIFSQKEVNMTVNKKEITLTCFLMYKQLQKNTLSRIA